MLYKISIFVRDRSLRHKLVLLQENYFCTFSIFQTLHYKGDNATWCKAQQWKILLILILISKNDMAKNDFERSWCSGSQILLISESLGLLGMGEGILKAAECHG